MCLPPDPLVVAMSDELPPPPVSKSRASQIAINFAGRVKHQMKDERKQVARLPPRTPQPHHQACWDTHLLTRTARRAAVDRAREGARIGGSAQGEEAHAQVQLRLLLLAATPSHHSRARRCYLTTRFYSPRAAAGRSSRAIRTLSCAARTRSSPRTRRKATRTASCAGECLDVL